MMTEDQMPVNNQGTPETNPARKNQETITTPSLKAFETLSRQIFSKLDRSSSVFLQYWKSKGEIAKNCILLIAKEVNDVRLDNHLSKVAQYTLKHNSCLNTEILVNLLPYDKEGEINRKDKNRNTVLHRHLLKHQTSHVEIASLLINSISAQTLNVRNDQGMTALDLALHYRNNTIVNKILQRQDACRVSYHQRILHGNIVDNEQYDKEKIMLLVAISIIDLKIADYPNLEELFRSALNGNFISVYEFLDAYSKQDIKDGCFHRAICCALLKGHDDIALAMINSIDGNYPFCPVEATFCAAFGQCELSLSKLIAKGVDCSAQDTYGNTALHYLIARGCQYKAVPLMLKLKDEALVIKSTHQGHSPLYLAALFKQNIVLMALLARGVDVNMKDSQGNTALHAAMIVKNDCAALALISYGAKTNVSNILNVTPRQQIISELKYFLLWGADQQRDDNDQQGQIYLPSCGSSLGANRNPVASKEAQYIAITPKKP